MLETEIKKLREAVEKLTEAMQAQGAAPQPREIVDALTDTVNAADVVPEEKPNAISPRALKDITLEKARAGHSEAIRERLNDFGVKKIHDLGENTDEFYKWVIALESS